MACGMEPLLYSWCSARNTDTVLYLHSDAIRTDS